MLRISMSLIDVVMLVMSSMARDAGTGSLVDLFCCRIRS